ncbi:hypothetical protein PILCRDRAFT_16063 [Piloderma croceum F 1598]|uniref:Uncharacterized protein n=1 Tax=Piloderma croceum (strain F 1598) TaxID=765440 RepID=A0A0C3EXL7_PILCF|nr:hypothetical protein PILCRDRAFT_16063 [Piloderma croceum F 1598]
MADGAADDTADDVAFIVSWMYQEEMSMAKGWILNLVRRQTSIYGNVPKTL